MNKTIKKPVNNRELSWLDFNERVLMEALDVTNPLLERMKFLAIFSSNMDEFFMVRVSGIYKQIGAGYEQPDNSGMLPKEVLAKVTEKAKNLSKRQQSIFTSLKKELEKESVFFPEPNLEEHDDVTEAIFLNEILPVISPVTLDPSHPFPFIYGRRLCLLAELEKNGKPFTSLVMIPETIKRSYVVRHKKDINVFTVENILNKHIHMLFKGYSVKNILYFRVTRDADLIVQEEESPDLLRSIEHLLSQRKLGDVNRIEISQGVSDVMMNFLKEKINFTDAEVHHIDGTIDLTFLFSLVSVKDGLTFPPLKQRPLERLKNGNLFEEIKNRPVFLFRPFNSFSVVSDLIEAAAVDPDVLAIKMTLYRANQDSRIIASLLEAAKRGKQVSVVVELKARFDEERNIEWAKNLEKAGCIVTYGIVGLKIHAKCMLIVRKEENRIVRYTHVATGNYNENTATVYTDIDLISTDEHLGRDATKLFNYLMGYTQEDDWHMGVAPFTLRNNVIKMIDEEIKFARKGKEARIIMKVNSLLDDIVINKLYEASDAGVKIDLIVRGICGIKAGVKGLSENIKVISVVGRFLEHSRVLYFKHNGSDKFFITSADMMRRNLSNRVELLVEIEDERFKASLKHYLKIILKDNCKAWELKDDRYLKIIPSKNEEHMNSQEYFLNNII